MRFRVSDRLDRGMWYRTVVGYEHVIEKARTDNWRGEELVLFSAPSCCCDMMSFDASVLLK